MVQVYSEHMEKYFDNIDDQVKKTYDFANKARAKGYDGNNKVEVSLAKNMAERVVGLISTMEPQIEGSGVVERILELEEKFGSLDWRVAMQIALEIAENKFIKFDDKVKAIEIGVRTGFAYITVGVVSSPLEGFTNLSIKKTKEGKEYFSINFAGPIRNAGGTAASVFVMVCDYVRKHLGYAKYDPTPEEIKRIYTELQDYHEKITNLQYFPTKEETEFMAKNLPVQIDGDGTEAIEVSNFKRLDRIESDRIRSGFCLVYSSCIQLKAPKLWKKLKKWGHEMEMEDWDFLKDYVDLQKKMKSKGSKAPSEEDSSEEKPKVLPNYAYVKDLVAGRPIFGHPMRKGAFRLRYGRSRTNGFSAQSCHPATMVISKDFIANATQLKMERPGKAAAFTSCDTLEGPIVKLDDDSVIRVNDESLARKIMPKVKEILFLGDNLVNFGDFLNRNHTLLPPGYVEEWWIKELRKSLISLGYKDENVSKKDLFFQYSDLKIDDLSKLFGIKNKRLIDLLSSPLKIKPSFEEAFVISRLTKTPLHPNLTFHYNDISFERFSSVIKSFLKANFYFGKSKSTLDDSIFDKPSIASLKFYSSIDKISIPVNENQSSVKRSFEEMGIPHKFVDNNIILDGDFARSLLYVLGIFEESFITEFMKNEDFKKILNSEDLEFDFFNEISKNLVKKVRIKDGSFKNPLEYINKDYDYIFVRDKSGIYVGSRLGRPEKAKPRELKGKPHGLFPVAEQGGRNRSLNAAIQLGYVEVESQKYVCEKCKIDTTLKRCPKCDEPTRQMFYQNNSWVKEVNEKEPFSQYAKWKIPIDETINSLNKKLKMVIPPLVKGVKGMMSGSKFPEHPVKAILRAKHDVKVNKDGTIRYDASEVPITHFKPFEVGASIDRLKELGYAKDIYGNDLEDDHQILELYPQDILLPSAVHPTINPADKTMVKTANFIDELLVKLYGMEPFYNIKTREDLIGHLVLVLAPHTSAASLGRIVGFSDTQGLYAHPLMHAAIRRDCDGDEGAFFLALDAFLNFSREYIPSTRGGTMDMPLVLTSILNPMEVDDMILDMDKNFTYPLEFYEACQEYKYPYELEFMDTVNNHTSDYEQYENYGFTHDTSNINLGAKVSSYKFLPSMLAKMKAEFDFCFQTRAVDETDVAYLTIEKHFLKDIKGNLRKFSQQSFRCSNCNTIFRRPPLNGKCTVCNRSSLIFTISEGSVKKYLIHSNSLIDNYKKLPTYLKETVSLLNDRVDQCFGIEQFKQETLFDF